MIEITHYEKSSRGKIVAFIDISIPNWGIIIRRIVKVINNGKIWYNMPTFPKDLPDGRKVYSPYVQFTTNNIIFLEKLTEAVAAYEANMDKQPAKAEEPPLDLDNLPF